MIERRDQTPEQRKILSILRPYVYIYNEWYCVNKLGIKSSLQMRIDERMLSHAKNEIKETIVLAREAGLTDQAIIKDTMKVVSIVTLESYLETFFPLTSEEDIQSFLYKAGL